MVGEDVQVFWAALQRGETAKKGIRGGSAECVRRGQTPVSACSAQTGDG
jgi:hypothetical protein